MVIKKGFTAYRVNGHINIKSLWSKNDHRIWDNLTMRETNAFAKKIHDAVISVVWSYAGLWPEWKVSDMEANFQKMTVDITIEYLPKKGIDPESEEICPNQTYIRCRVPRVKSPEGKARCIQVPWADSYNRYTYMFAEFVVMVLQASQNKIRELFQFIFGCGDIYAASTMFGLWIREAVRPNVKEILEVVETIKA